MTNNNSQNLRVVSLSSGIANDESFENILRNAGHKVTTLTSTEPAFALVNSNWPDIVIFNPVSNFGMSGSVKRLRASFNGPIVAVGEVKDPTIPAMLAELGVDKFALTPGELARVVPTLNIRENRVANYDVGTTLDAPYAKLLDQASDHETPDLAGQEERQLTLVATSVENANLNNEGTDGSHAAESITSRISFSPSFHLPSLKLPSLEWPSGESLKFSLPMQRWHRTALGAVMTALVITAVAIPFFNSRSADDSDTPVARALPIVPRIMTEPLAPLTLAEISGEILPLEISGIRDQAVIEELAVAFWGDTAPDAFVTVNGEPVEVSPYGAFVIDYPLEDGANFIEVLASDFQGRTSRKSFTVVSLQ
ncbi:MAG: hypothetical protein H8D69_01840 [Chloroflexi bacterium]|nr:hypothetical protein [Chloroflexota bacterium]